MADRPRVRAIVEAAYRLIAERGLEGFRVRAVAEAAGIHHATLLHYFPSKQALLEAVIDALLEQLQQEGAAHPDAPPLEALIQEFNDLRRRLTADRAFFVVLHELALRAYRDPATAALLERLETAWRGYLTGLVARGIATGLFRADLPVPAVVETLILQMRGLALRALDPKPAEGLEAVVDLLATIWTSWLTGSPSQTGGDAP